MARILVVDDAAFMRKMVSDALTKGGHEVVGEAGNGVEALERFQELKPELTTLVTAFLRKARWPSMFPAPVAMRVASAWRVSAVTLKPAAIAVSSEVERASGAPSWRTCP